MSDLLGFLYARKLWSRFDSTQNWGWVTALALLLGFVLSGPASAQSVPETYDGFVYGTGELTGENGGTGDWKDPWSGASEIRVASPGFTYTDTSGNELTVSGNRVGKSGSAGSVNSIDRTINSTVNSGTVWASALIDGHNTARIHNVGLGDGLFFGQGTKDSNSNRLGLADADGNTSLAPVSFSPNDLHFLVVRVDFSGGNEEAWLWIDPVLDSEPGTGTANANLASVKEFEFSFVRLQTTRNSNQAGLDEVRLGSTFEQVTPHTSSAVCGDLNVDAGEDCDGGACCTPGCAFELVTTECNPSADSCDVAEFCDGSSATCPADVVLTIGTECRGGGICDPAETCDGVSTSCPANAFSNPGESCGDGPTECSQQDTCDSAGTCDTNHLA
ncbi:MAG: hypothetical protein HRU00_03335, partial [Myxococcales bacterium]|nr:hypothetical protein [Myxococcales bacterium]